MMGSIMYHTVVMTAHMEAIIHTKQPATGSKTLYIGKGSDNEQLCYPLRNRRAIRFLLHPRVGPGNNVSLEKLARAYKLPVKVVASGHGRDEHGNFVVLLNRQTLQRAISKRRKSDKELSHFVDMVLSLWSRYPTDIMHDEQDDEYHDDEMHVSEEKRE